MNGVPVNETALQNVIIEMARLFRWRHYHSWTSIHSPAGFPDLVLVRPPRLIFAELKARNRHPTRRQEEWLADLRSVPGIETYLWRPDDLGEIERLLR